MRRMFKFRGPLTFRKQPVRDIPNWSWEEHGHQDFQRAEGAEHRVEALMVVVALLIVAAVGVRLYVAYQGLTPY
jgi:hypothetical protein